MTTTPNPSRSVSPEPTKGETQAAMERLWLTVFGPQQGRRSQYQAREDLVTATRAFESAVRAEYIPLVEAARRMVDEWAYGDFEYQHEFKETDAIYALDAALVQVPGQQQQVEQESVGGAG